MIASKITACILEGSRDDERRFRKQNIFLYKIQDMQKMLRSLVMKRWNIKEGSCS